MSQQALVRFCVVEYSQMMDDYTHLIEHSRSSRDAIRSVFIKQYGFMDCNINNCLFINRDRETMNRKTDDIEYTFYCQLFDSLHGLIFHQTKCDTHKIDKNDKFILHIDDIHDQKDETMHLPMEGVLVMLEKHKVDSKDSIRLYDFLRNEEYDTESMKYDIHTLVGRSNILCELQTENAKSMVQNIFKEAQVISRIFTSGILYWYWPYYKSKHSTQKQEKETNIMSIYSESGVYIDKPKYNHLKDEFIAFKSLGIAQWNNCVLQRAIKLIQTGKCKKLSSANRDKELHYNIKRGTAISLHNIQAIIMHSDFRDLTRPFYSTFRPNSFGESLSSITKRHSSFYHLAKALRETVQYFGDNPCGGVYYCGIKVVLGITSFAVVLNSPLTTSMHIWVAIKCSTRGGMVLQVQNDGDYESRNHLRSFDCSLISIYPEDNERLFYEPGHSIRMTSVILVKTTVNYRAFWRAFYVLDCMLNGTNMEGATIRDSKVSKKRLLTSINHELDKSANNMEGATIHNSEVRKRFLLKSINQELDKLDKLAKIRELYVIDTFHSFCIHKTEITINVNMLDLYFNSFHDLIMDSVQEDDDKDNKTNNDNVNIFKHETVALFPNLRVITIVTTSEDGSDSYSLSLNTLLVLIAGLKHLYLKKVIVKASWDKDDIHEYVDSRSWLFDLWDKQSMDIKKRFGAEGYKITLKAIQTAKMDEDWLTMEKN
eukprot:141288_1